MGGSLFTTLGEREHTSFLVLFFAGVSTALSSSCGQDRRNSDHTHDTLLPASDSFVSWRRESIANGGLQQSLSIFSAPRFLLHSFFSSYILRYITILAGACFGSC